MIAEIFALLLIMDHKIVEHRIQPSLSECLKGKRIAQREAKNNVQYECLKSQAELETNIDGSKTIKKLILE